MEFFETLNRRHSIRSFKNREVEQAKLQKLLGAVNSAPSAGDLQGYDIVLVRDGKRKDALCKAAYGQDFVRDAPVVLVFCANASRSSGKYEKRGEELYSVQDATIACAFAHLSCVPLGLGSCWVGAFDEEEVSGIIRCPDGVRPVAILPIGYPDDEPEATPRRELDDLVKKDGY